MKRRILIGVWTVLAFLSLMGRAVPARSDNTVIEDPKTLHELACTNSVKSDSAWHIGNLYDCASRSIFIPYQLWTGAKWDGNKNSPCMHRADTTFYVNDKSGTTIKGPKDWKNRKVWVRDKITGFKTQYFACHEKGIGRVYEDRNGRERFWPKGRCKFPGGHGWKLSTQRYCTDTAIEIDKIEIDKNRDLTALEFKWWFKSRSRGNYVLDHRYRYEPNTGSTNAWPQR